MSLLADQYKLGVKSAVSQFAINHYAPWPGTSHRPWWQTGENALEGAANTGHTRFALGRVFMATSHNVFCQGNMQHGLPP